MELHRQDLRRDIRAREYQTVRQLDVAAAVRTRNDLACKVGRVFNVIAAVRASERHVGIAPPAISSKENADCPRAYVGNLSDACQRGSELTKQTATATGVIENQPGGKPKTSRRQ